MGPHLWDASDAAVLCLGRNLAKPLFNPVRHFLVKPKGSPGNFRKRRVSLSICHTNYTIFQRAVLRPNKNLPEIGIFSFRQARRIFNYIQLI